MSTVRIESKKSLPRVTDQSLMRLPSGVSLHGKRRKRRKKKKDPFDLPGVHKIVLSELAQKIIGCVAGADVTAEKPWKFVDKELILDNLELHEESSEFLPMKKEILSFRRDQILMGYIPDESREFDEFYICVTVVATEQVTEIIEKIKKDQEERLYNTVYKTVKAWDPQGSAEEVDEAIDRNNRPLIEVEVETKYPICPNKIMFKLIKAEDKRDGYMELRCTEELINVYKTRLDAYVQAAPQFIEAEAQTICTYPRNSNTQYLYELDENPKYLEKCKKHIIKYAGEQMENISDMLLVNGTINLYTDDYYDLSKDKVSKWSKASALADIKEHMSFMDVGFCRDKMIADAVWHPMWTGTIAIAYCDISPNIYNSGAKLDDRVLKAVHGENPVLLWSCVDALKPKLILETPKEVLKLSFCKFDENILIGGCRNGQIIIWDIRNKLNKVEELEVLTVAQQKYRLYMNSLMGWMKNIHNLALVRPTAISDLRYSHKGYITGITWLSPFHEFTKMGVLESKEEDSEDRSMQFMTCGNDGTVHIWDLLKKPTIVAGGFKIKKLKRLKKKPSALMVDASPFALLHMNLRPIYKVKIRKSDEKHKVLALSGFCSTYCQTKYVEACPDKNKRGSLDDRIIYKPVFKKQEDEIMPKLHVATMEGDYAYVKWEGMDFDSGEVVNAEICTVISMGKYHDGPINSVETAIATNATLTVGGKIFAIWREDFKNRPILWRRNRQLYTSGEWNLFQPYMFSNKVVNGEVETWILHSSSKKPTFSLTYTSEYLTTSAIHPRKLKKNIYGAGDKQGAFRLFSLIEDNSKGSLDKNTQTFNTFLDREVARKKEFMVWQEEWNKKNEAWIKKKEEEQRLLMQKEEEEKRAKELEEFERENKPAAKPAPKGPQPGELVEWIKEQRAKNERERIKSTIISKKQLDTKELEKRRKPLQKLDEENEKKKKKQKQRLKERDNIFKDTVAMLFPEVVKVKPPPPPDPYAAGDVGDEHERCYYDYMEVATEAHYYIQEHPYIYEFNWRKVLTGGKARRRQLDESHVSMHRERNVKRFDKVEERPVVFVSQPVQVPDDEEGMEFPDGEDELEDDEAEGHVEGIE